MADAYDTLGISLCAFEAKHNGHGYFGKIVPHCMVTPRRGSKDRPVWSPHPPITFWKETFDPMG